MILAGVLRARAGGGGRNHKIAFVQTTLVFMCFRCHHFVCGGDLPACNHVGQTHGNFDTKITTTKQTNKTIKHNQKQNTTKTTKTYKSSIRLTNKFIKRRGRIQLIRETVDPPSNWTWKTSVRHQTKQGNHRPGFVHTPENAGSAFPKPLYIRSVYPGRVFIKNRANFSVSPGDPMGSLVGFQLHYLCPCILAL